MSWLTQLQKLPKSDFSGGSKPASPSHPGSSEGAEASDATSQLEQLKREYERYTKWKNAFTAKTPTLTPTGASGVNTTTSAIQRRIQQGMGNNSNSSYNNLLGQLGGGGVNLWPGQAPWQEEALDKLTNMSEQQIILQRVMAQVQAQLAALAREEQDRLRKLPKDQLARECLQEIKKIREKLDIMTSALAVVCLENDEPVEKK